MAGQTEPTEVDKQRAALLVAFGKLYWSLVEDEAAAWYLWDAFKGNQKSGY